MSIVYTIGYEGTDIARCLATLKAVGVEVLADIRAVPLSRKKGFSKNALRASLEEEGLEYVHFGELGDPKEGREAARAGRYSEFFRIFTEHLAGEKPQAALSVLREIASKRATCLLCFERDPKECHRSIVASRLENSDMLVFDLYGDLPTRYVDHAVQLSRRHLGQGIAAA
jgi:uncharacterized protein (DUF488 family)